MPPPAHPTWHHVPAWYGHQHLLLQPCCLAPFPSHTSSSMSLGGNFFLAFGRQSGHMLPFPIGANLTHTQKKLFKSEKSLGKTHGWCKEDEEDWDQETLRLCQYVTVTVTAKPPLQSLVPCWVRTLKFWCTLLTPLHRPSQIWSHSSFLQKKRNWCTTSTISLKIYLSRIEPHGLV